MTVVEETIRSCKSCNGQERIVISTKLSVTEWRKIRNEALKEENSGRCRYR